MAIITISRGTFSGGKELAETVASKLGYKCISREEVIKGLDYFGIPEKILTNVLQKAPPFWDRYKETKRHYLTLIKFGILEEAVKNNIVYHGYAAHILLREHYWTLRVKLMGNMAYRIEQAMTKQNLDRDAAIQYIYDIDESRKKWINFLHGIDWDLSTIFDIVLNIQIMDIDGAVDAVVTLANKEPFRPSEISDRILRKMHLVSKAEVALLNEKETRSLNIDMSCIEEGILELKGSLKTKKLRSLILGVVGRVDGVVDINDKMTDP
jgi:cytidylate kinase